jgi:hypothetical protein
MNRAVLELVSGPGEGRQIEVHDEVVIGRGVDGPGRIEGAQGSVGERQLLVRLTDLGLEVEGLDELGRTHVGPSGGRSVGKGETYPGGYFADPTSFLLKGGRIELRPQHVQLGARGDSSTALEVADLEIDWMSRVSAEDLLDPVRFRPALSLRPQPGYLHASGNLVALRGRTGTFLEEPLDGVRALLPPWRSRLLRLAAGGSRCTVVLSAGVPGDPAWRRRRQWKAVLRGKRTLAEVAAERRETTALRRRSSYGRTQ